MLESTSAATPLSSGRAVEVISSPFLPRLQFRDQLVLAIVELVQSGEIFARKINAQCLPRFREYARSEEAGIRVRELDVRTGGITRQPLAQACLRATGYVL